MSDPSSASLPAGERCAIIIPARFGSTRFPGKPLTPIAGPDGVSRPLIEWTHRAAAAIAGTDTLHVATDSAAIADAVAAFGGRSLMTSPDCRNGTERIAACLDLLPNADIFVNMQGDALLTPPPFVAMLRDHMRAHPRIQVATVATRCTEATFRHLAEDAAQGRVGGTTAVVDARGNALYFSKRILPYLPAGSLPTPTLPVLLHLGLYAYRRAALERYAASPPCAIEQAEGLEQLRFLHEGVPISVLVLDDPGHPLVEVNNPSDVSIVETILRSRDLA